MKKAALEVSRDLADFGFRNEYLNSKPGRASEEAKEALDGGSVRG